MSTPLCVPGRDWFPGHLTWRRGERVPARPGESEPALPAVISSSADHILVVMRETDVRHVSGVAKVTLMFGLWAKVNRDSWETLPLPGTIDHIQDSRLPLPESSSLLPFPFGLDISVSQPFADWPSHPFFPEVANVYIFHPPFPRLPEPPLQREMKPLGITKPPQGRNKIPLVLDSSWPSQRGPYLLQSAEGKSPEAVQGGYSEEDSQIFLCMENQRASLARSHLRWQCWGQHGSHTRSWHQPCLHFVARCQWLHPPECCLNEKRSQQGRWEKASHSQASSPRDERQKGLFCVIHCDHVALLSPPPLCTQPRSYCPALP